MQKPVGVFNFEELLPLADKAADLPPLKAYMARDGAVLHFRHYPCVSEKQLILLHGSAAHSAILHAFAAYLSERNIVNVYTPDLRGHGAFPIRRGDIDYQDQLEDDLIDLIGYVKRSSTREGAMFIGGHSSGGGLAFRLCSRRHQEMIDGLLLLAPYLGHDAPMAKRNAGGWARPNIPKIVVLSVLEAFGIRNFSGAKVLRFELPAHFRTGLETIEYSFRLMKGMHPTSFRKAARRCKVPMLVLIGAPDESLRAEEFRSVFKRRCRQADVEMLHYETHLGIVMSHRSMTKAADWLAARP